MCYFIAIGGKSRAPDFARGFPSLADFQNDLISDLPIYADAYLGNDGRFSRPRRVRVRI